MIRRVVAHLSRMARFRNDKSVSVAVSDQPPGDRLAVVRSAVRGALGRIFVAPEGH